MPKKNKAPMPRTLHELDPPEPIGQADSWHADEFADVYLDVEPQFGGTPGEMQRYHALLSRVPGRVLGEPDLSGFTPPPAPSVDERILRAAVTSPTIDPEARQGAMERLDALRRSRRSSLKQGQHKGQERLAALRGELVLSVFACAGRTGFAVSDLISISLVSEDWWKNHKTIPTRELREESRRSHEMAFYAANGGFQYARPLKPSEWDDRYTFLTGEEPREPPMAWRG